MGTRFAATILTLALSSCVDEPQPIPPPGSGTRAPATRLSALGIFRGALRDQNPAAGFIPYEVNVELWSDGAKKRRFLHLPPGAVIRADRERWALPDGAYLVKTFSFPRDVRDPDRGERLVETRFLARTGGRYVASTYLWNEEQTDAVVSGGNVDVPVRFVDAAGVAREQTFHVPGTSQCDTCHDGRALGLRTRQMDRDAPDVARNQIDRLVELGWLVERPSHALTAPFVDPFGDAPLEDRARAYLDGNCGHCHAPGREAGGTEVYWDWAHTQTDLPLCVPSERVGAAEHVVFPGAPERSTAITRTRAADPFFRMPLGSNHVPDERGIAVLVEWIASMPRRECP